MYEERLDGTYHTIDLPPCYFCLQSLFSKSKFIVVQYHYYKLSYFYGELPRKVRIPMFITLPVRKTISYEGVNVGLVEILQFVESPHVFRYWGFQRVSVLSDTYNMGSKHITCWICWNTSLREYKMFRALYVSLKALSFRHVTTVRSLMDTKDCSL